MGNAVTFSGYGGSPERACEFLEEDVRKKFPDAFVTVSDDSVKVVSLSPRSVGRVALVNFGNGQSKEVEFKRDRYGVTCTVQY